MTFIAIHSSNTPICLIMMMIFLNRNYNHISLRLTFHHNYFLRWRHITSSLVSIFIKLLLEMYLTYVRHLFGCSFYWRILLTSSLRIILRQNLRLSHIVLIMLLGDILVFIIKWRNYLSFYRLPNGYMLYWLKFLANRVLFLNASIIRLMHTYIL